MKKFKLGRVPDGDEIGGDNEEVEPEPTDPIPPIGG